MTELAPTPPHIIGPTWQKTTDDGWYLPERTLGWGVLNWWAEYVKTPGGDHAGESFMPTLEQARFTLWWYAVDETGAYAFREAVLRRLKGWGKDPYVAAVSLVELCGPVAFSHFDANGEPVGKQRHAPWIQIAAVSQDQTKNTFRLFPVMVSSKLKQSYGLETHKFLIYAAAGGQIEAVTAAPASMEGNRPTLVIRNEALALDTPLPTPSGWTTIGAVQSGDWVIDPDGTPVEVSYTTPVQHDRKCFVVKFEDGEEITASDGHFWYAKSGAVKGEFTTQELLDSGKSWRVPRTKPVEFPEAALDIDPYLLGLWLGDGHTNEALITAHATQIESLESRLNGRGIETRRRKDRGENWGRFSIPGATAKLSKIGVLGHKHIPAQYLRASLDQRLELVRGLMDSDGGISEAGQCYFGNTNEKLVYGVQELLLSLGEKPIVRWLPRADYTNGGCYKLSFYPAAVNPFGLPDKAARVRQSGERQRWKTITSITPTESVPVKCISVKSGSHLFLAGERWTATRNTQWWGAGPGGEANDGHAMAEVIEGNVTKIAGARTLSICNAHIPGYDTVAERDYDGWQDIQAGKAVDVGKLYDALEAPADTPVSEIPSQKEDPEGYEQGVQQLREGIEIARGDSYWLPVEEIVKSVLDTKNSITESRRKFLNQVNAHEDSWVSPPEWDRLALTGEVFRLQPGEKITLGFDGSKSNDWTALVACRVFDGCLFLIKAWDPSKHANDEVPREDVDATVRSCFERYDVVAFRADVKEFEAYVDQWGRDFRKKIKVNASPNNPVAFDMRGQQKRFALDCERMLDAVIEREVFHDGNPVLRQHVLNARRHPTTYDAISIRKASKDSSKKIDAAVCCVLAFGARQDYQMSKKNRSGGAAIIR